MEEKSTGYKSINKESNFFLSFSIDKESIVDVQMDWPMEPVSEQLLENIASLLYSVNSGQTKSLTAEALSNCANDEELYDYVKIVVQKWLEFDNIADDGPAIKPRDTLN